LASGLQEPDSQLTSGHPLHFQFFTTLCSLFGLAVYLLYLRRATTSLPHTHRWLPTNFRPNFLLSGSSCNAATFCRIFDAYISSFKLPVTPTPQHSVAFSCPNPYFTMPSKSRKSQPPAPHSSRRKPKLRSSPTPAPYLVVDTTLPSSIFSERSLFVTYSPQSRIFRTAFGNDIVIEGTGEVHVRVFASGQPITLRLKECWHVPSSPHHFLSTLSSTLRGNQFIIASRTPRLLFNSKFRITEPNSPKYVPFTREDGFLVLRFKIPVSLAPVPQVNPLLLPIPNTSRHLLPSSKPLAFSSLSFHLSSFLSSPLPSSSPHIFPSYPPPPIPPRPISHPSSITVNKFSPTLLPFNPPPSPSSQHPSSLSSFTSPSQLLFYSPCPLLDLPPPPLITAQHTLLPPLPPGFFELPP
jgi:hypothetical protein